MVDGWPWGMGATTLLPGLSYGVEEDVVTGNELQKTALFSFNGKILFTLSIYFNDIN